MERDRATSDKSNSPCEEQRLWFDDHLVHIAPHPIFPGLEGLNNGMLGGMKMFGGVFVLGGIAATDVPALAAKPQVDPAVTHLEALFAALGMWLNFLDMSGVRTDRAHASSFVAWCNSSG
jgi:hypothetical protein